MRSRFLSESASLTVGPVGAVGRRRHGRPRVGNLDDGDLLSIGSEVESGHERRKDGRLRQLTRLAGRRHRRSRCASRRREWTKIGDARAVGRPVAFEIRAPGGNWIGAFEPSAAEMKLDADVVADGQRPCAVRLVVDEHTASSWKGLENVFIGTGPSPISSRNHFLSGLSVREADVQVARRQDGVSQLLRRRLVPSCLSTSSAQLEDGPC